MTTRGLWSGTRQAWSVTENPMSEMGSPFRQIKFINKDIDHLGLFSSF